MTALRWAAAPLLVGALASNAAAAAAQAPAPAPTPTPTPAPTAAVDPAPAPAADPAPAPDSVLTPAVPDVVTGGTVVYVTTVTTTTTILNAPLTVIAAPVTTTLNTTNSTSNSTSSNSSRSDTTGAANRDAAPARPRLVMNLTGCGRPAGGSRPAQARRARRAHVRLAAEATLVVRVNGERVTAIRLPAGARHPRVSLRLRLAPSGMLTIRRPSGRVLAVQGCTPGGVRPAA
jgi:hypothetical protein